ncbi:MAG TPA: helix-turn-helix transcriptional regulator [Rhizobiaceae bacterium]|nr:helix-turn-helix transcriptional regulator [Rhizobiaceae bacterium]
MAKRVRPRFKSGPRRHFIRQWREYRGLTQEQLAERIDVTAGTISQLENGRISYTQPTLEAIAEALQTTPGDILNVDPTREGAIWSIWETLATADREQVIKIVRTFQKTGTEG